MKYFFILMMLSCFSYAQILDHYPKDQENYYGGKARFYKDFHDIATEQHMKPCENKQEFYRIKLVIYPDKTVKYVHPEDTAAVAKNKCTFDLTKNVLKYMDRWKPATVDGKEVPALASFLIYPDDLFENYTAGYTPDKFLKPAEFPGGLDAFRNKVFKVSDLTGFKFTDLVKVIVRFTVEPDGSTGEYGMLQSSGLKAFDDRVISNLKYVKNRWKPATFHDIPITQNYSLPITITAQ